MHSKRYYMKRENRSEYYSVYDDDGFLEYTAIRKEDEAKQEQEKKPNLAVRIMHKLIKNIS